MITKKQVKAICEVANLFWQDGMLYQAGGLMHRPIEDIDADTVEEAIIQLLRNYGLIDYQNQSTPKCDKDQPDIAKILKEGK
jgi:hypothetical protein